MVEEISKFHTVRGYQLLSQNKNLLTSAMEDYLEMIYRNSLVEGYMRVNTLSELLNVAAPSATKMVQKLSKLGLLDYKKYGIIFLTENGREIGKFLLERHNTIQEFLNNLGVSEDILTETELIEHYVSLTTLSKIGLFNKFLINNPEICRKLSEFIKLNSEHT
ncbi:Mn-dependent transcriptional regulator [Ruminiclostridium cellobioparum subsp. termitidis CT1112]|uniref:Manganese transport regulator n=1 Tax=Ruminiclostridium cellobioparum subsp. termitidis CT1112 TaxID=1195236 RepID=S0FGL0_RUMCE|nr:Mn-dependent transcriptional regulator [Ruminiclostridium cellobioparum subsp. termitidis CT1112]